MDPGGSREAALTASGEALKRNTDCVYFLASPWSCKKGSECEYRHSEGARLNPKDCWYWLNSNCSHRRCSFRHPSLVGLFENPGTTLLPARLLACHKIKKQSVPCRFFPKGLCSKGDKCPFMHVPQPTGTPVAQLVAKVSAALTQALKESWGPEECLSRQNIPKAARIDKLVQLVASTENPATKAESLPYNEDDFCRDTAQGGRNLHDRTDLNNHLSGYEPVTSFERGQYNGMDQHDRYGRVHNSYSLEQRMTSSERMLDKQLIYERRVLQGEDSGEMDGSDLRHCLLKQKGLNGLRSTASKDRCSDAIQKVGHYVEEEETSLARESREDHQRFPRESSISTRLQGRLTLPIRFPPDWPIDQRLARERDTGTGEGPKVEHRPLRQYATRGGTAIRES